MNASAQLISELPLKEMDGALLFPAVQAEAARVGHDVPLVSSAMNLASYLHRKQTRANRGDLPRTCYIEHPLRGTMRAYRYGVTDINIIIGEILHDTVEDNPLEFAAQIAGRPTDDEVRARVTAFAAVQKMYGPGVEAIVRGMTNDISVPGLSRAEKHANYVKHVVIAIEDPRVAIAKFIDFVDNAVGLHHNLQGAGTGMVVRLATKYTPLVPIFFERLQRDDVRALVSANGHNDMMAHLQLGADRLSGILRQHGPA